MNGTQNLYFDFTERLESHQPSPADEHASTVDEEAHSTGSSLQGRSAPSERITNDQFKSFKDAIDRCCAQRLAAHQRTILHFVAAEQARTARQLLFARRHEWVSMILEDQRSQMLRGLLVLDANTLARVQAAYRNGTQRARKQQAKVKSNGDGGNHTQLLEICKDLGLPTDSVGGVQRQLEAIQSERKQRRRQQTGDNSADNDGAGATRDEQWPLADVAEWWRRHLVQVAMEKAAVQQPTDS